MKMKPPTTVPFPGERAAPLLLALLLAGSALPSGGATSADAAEPAEPAHPRPVVAQAEEAGPAPEGRRPATVREAGFDDPRVHAIERKLRCTCGCNLDIHTCQRQMQCGISPGMSRTVRERVAAGLTGEEILDEFVAEKGQSILMAPPKEGFNWVGYLLPFVALGIGGALVFGLVRRWSERSPSEARAATPEISEEELRRVETELARFEDEL